MEIDHIFIFSNTNGKEADALVEFGFTEGSSRVHPGQGTTNRKFYVDNFFLEILWVINEQEIQSKLTSPTKLWERSQFYRNDHSRFGLCLRNTEVTDRLFESSSIYQPDYFPKGMFIEIITNNQNPSLPWTFRLPYRDAKNVINDTTLHANGIKCLTKVDFEIKSTGKTTSFARALNKLDNISIHQRDFSKLILEFDNHLKGKTKEFSSLDLIIKY